MMDVLIRCVLTVLLSVLAGCAAAGQSVPTWVLVDPSGRETIDTITDRDRQHAFRGLTGGFSGGFTRAAHWFRIELPAPPKGPDGNRQWLLEIMPPYLDDLRVYLPAAHGRDGFEEHRHGDRLPFVDRTFRHRAFLQLVPFDRAEPITIYIRLETTSSSLLSIRAHEPQRFLEATATEYALLGVLFGLIGAALIAQVSRLMVARDSLDRASVFYFLAMIWLLLSINGLSAEFLFPTQPYWADQLASLASILVGMAATRFYREALQIDHFFPLLGQVYRGLFWVFALSVPVPFFDLYVEAAGLIFFAVLVVLVIGMSISVVLIRRNIEGGVVLLAAHFFSLAGSLSTALTLLGWLPGDFWLIYAYQIGFLGNLLAVQWLMATRSASLRRRVLAEQRGRELAEALAGREHRQVEEQRRFIAMLTHELKTPLSVIRMSLGADRPSEVMRRRAREAVADVDAVVDRVAQAARFDEEAEPPVAQSCILHDAVEQAVAALRAAGRRVELEMTPPVDGPSRVRCEPRALKTVLTNLLDNATKYGDPRIPVRLDWDVRERGGLAGFAVRVANRTGKAGRPDPARVFEKYYRAPAAHGTVGSGLGLYIVRGLVDQMGGSLVLLSGQEEVVFELWLPQ